MGDRHLCSERNSCGGGSRCDERERGHPRTITARNAIQQGSNSTRTSGPFYAPDPRPDQRMIAYPNTPLHMESPKIPTLLTVENGVFAVPPPLLLLAPKHKKRPRHSDTHVFIHAWERTTLGKGPRRGTDHARERTMPGNGPRPGTNHGLRLGTGHARERTTDHAREWTTPGNKPRTTLGNGPSSGKDDARRPQGKRQ